MSRRFKYVILDQTFPRIGSEADTHANLAFGSNLGQPTSAGFATLDVGEGNLLGVSCFGESVSLKLKSDPTRDAAILLRLFQDPL